VLTFILKRILQAIPVIIAVITISFFLMKMAPGGPFSAEKNLPPEIIQSLNEYYHLDQPLYKQYFDYHKGFVRGDLGPSFKYPGRTVTEIISSSFPVSLELGIYALFVAMFIGVISGVIAALRPNTVFDYVPMSLAMVGICVPALLLGPLLVLVFGIWLGWFPVAGWYDTAYKVLPAITLGTAYAAYIARLSRSGMLEIMHQDFIRTARAKGVKERHVVLKHALRGGLVPVVSFMGPAAAGLITGSFVVETIFQVPGLARFFVQAAFNRDYTMIMGTTVFFATLIIMFNMVSDIILVWLNPRLDFSGEKSSS